MNKRYELLGSIAEGGLGVVFRARDTELGREVAVKRISAGKMGGCGTAVDALIREAQKQSALQHPNVVEVYDYGVNAEGGFIVMELVQGETLEDVILRGALPADDFDAVVRQTLAGVGAIHAKGILHLDLKPENLMVHRLPEGRLQVKILDFGLAKSTPQEEGRNRNPAAGWWAPCISWHRSSLNAPGWMCARTSMRWAAFITTR